MRQVLAIVVAVIAAVAFIGALFTLSQANQEQLDLTARLQSRAQLLAQSETDSILADYRSYATSSVQDTIDKFATEQRIMGIAVFDANGAPVALSSGFPANLQRLSIIPTTMDSNVPSGAFTTENGVSVYAYAYPITVDHHVIGALVDVQNAQYIDDAVWNIWKSNMIHLFLQILVFGGAIVLIIWYIFYRAIKRITESVQKVRSGQAVETRADFGFFRPLTNEITKLSSSLRAARTAASEEARMRLEKLDSPWTAERLKEFIKAFLKDRPIFVVSNGQPFVAKKVKNKIEWSVPAGGVITAIEPVMEATGGTWIALGSGEADQETADKDGKLKVPPEEPKYTLKRVFITEEERKGYYIGFANEALWPLCHLAHVRPVFRKEDWAEYRKVNGLFAKALLEEIRHVDRPIVLVQDYHLALVPEMIKKSRPDAQVSIFWHIPWPSAAQFAICPWRKEILEGMLGADLIGFHTQQYCNNFMDTVGAEIEARIDLERFSIVRSGHESRVDPFPISIAYPGPAESSEEPDRTILDELGIRAEHVAIGVDRLDYIKGIPERFRAVEYLIEQYPEYRERFTLLQIASPTRLGVGHYEEYAEETIAEANRINERFGTPQWKPIVLEYKSYSHVQLRNLYQLSDVCLVTSLHDGMNLVAKEYVATRKEENGVLILSHFTGASRDMAAAIVVNPYSAEEVAEAIKTAITMPESEQRRRMKTLRASVRDYNVYRWSAELIKSLATGS